MSFNKTFAIILTLLMSSCAMNSGKIRYSRPVKSIQQDHASSMIEEKQTSNETLAVEEEEVYSLDEDIEYFPEAIEEQEDVLNEAINSEGTNAVISRKTFYVPELKRFSQRNASDDEEEPKSEEKVKKSDPLAVGAILGAVLVFVATFILFVYILNKVSFGVLFGISWLALFLIMIGFILAIMSANRTKSEPEVYGDKTLSIAAIVVSAVLAGITLVWTLILGLITMLESLFG